MKAKREANSMPVLEVGSTALRRSPASFRPNPVLRTWVLKSFLVIAAMAVATVATTAASEDTKDIPESRLQSAEPTAPAQETAKEDDSKSKSRAVEPSNDSAIEPSNESANSMSKNFTTEKQWYEQPVDHANPSGETFKEQILYLKPAQLDTKNVKYIFFGLGNEIDSDVDRLERLWKSYGKPQDMLFILAEHRGYGQSQTLGDQTVPTYVTVDNAMKDYDRLIADLKKTYPTAVWVGAGYSYGGALTINFANAYPDAVDMILASSPPVRFFFCMTEYNDLIYANLGQDFTEQMAAHMVNLKPVKVHDDNWADRELLAATLTFMTQTTSFREMTPQISEIINLPTPEFMVKLKPMLPDAIKDAIVARRKESLSYEEAQTGKYNWYLWKWQQAYETGTQAFGAPFPHTKEEIIADYQASFKMQPPALNKPAWNLEKMIPKITMPFIMVNGGADPWLRLGVPRDNSYTNLDYVYNEAGEHVPDLWYEETGLEVGRRMRKHLEALWLKKNRPTIE